MKVEVALTGLIKAAYRDLAGSLTCEPGIDPRVWIISVEKYRR
jgi:hypothetical protein